MRELGISRLNAGAIRELHRHKEAEWAYSLIVHCMDPPLRKRMSRGTILVPANQVSSSPLFAAIA